MTITCDPRRHYWGWDETGQRLRVRPGPAEKAARDLLAGREGVFEIEVLSKEETYCVTSTWTSLRSQPEHGAEQISQLRLGQLFEVWTRDPSGLWCLGAGADGYPGWVRSWHLASDGTEESDFVVSSRWSVALAASRDDAELLVDLSFATRIRALGEAREGFCPWRLPDGREAWTPSADLADCASTHETGPQRILDWGRALLGIPYEWGGASSRGFDCSGLVQTLYSAAGVRLPRDTDLQVCAGVHRDLRDRRTWRPGDLLFYGEDKVNHVALLVDAKTVLHASGDVKKQVLEANGALNDHSLQFVVDPLVVEHES